MGAFGNLEVNLNDDVKKIEHYNIDDHILLILQILRPLN